MLNMGEWIDQRTDTKGLSSEAKRPSKKQLELKISPKSWGQGQQKVSLLFYLIFFVFYLIFKTI